MSFFEHYTMSIPLFAPTLEFLTHLHLKHFFVREKSHLGTKQQGLSTIPVHPDYNGSALVRLHKDSSKRVALDPSDDSDARNVRYWLSLADFFTFPHVVLFESIEHLVDILQDMWDRPQMLQTIHKAMRIENRNRLKSLLRYWRGRLLDIAEHSPHKPE